MKKEKGKSILNNKPIFNNQIWIIIAVLSIVYIAIGLLISKPITIDYNRFKNMVLSHDVRKVVVIKNQEYVEVTLKEESLQNIDYKDELEINGLESDISGPHYTFEITSLESFEKRYFDLTNSMKKDNSDEVEYLTEKRYDAFSFFQTWGFTIIILIGFWYLLRRMSVGSGAGGQIFNIGKSKASLFDSESKIKLTFEDVAGLDEAKEEVKEIVEFLKNPKKFTKLGGKIPKGALLVGPPGTGKTLLAKAVAGEAAVPFYSLSGSDFVEMFVGVGAARVRDLFKRANEKAPCIVFIDEIDAIGRSRGRGQMPGSNDERENTLNSLLVEMDGFSTDSGVIILAATNRPDVLDPALLRPGRFDRQISIDKPDLIGREAIFKVHAKNIKLDPNVNLKHLAAQTPGFAGAEIANVCNESALIAARKNKNFVEMDDFQDAIDRVIGGLEKKSKIISPEEKKIVAYHEAGHAITGWFLKYADPLVKVSIVPRGIAALGYAQYLPKEQYLYQTEQLLDDMCMALGGRAAEELVFGKISTGALSDLERITKMAYSMVTMYGMNNVIGNISFFDSKKTEYSFTKPYSDSTAEKIDYEVKRIVEKAYQRTINLLKEKKDQLELIAKELLKKEILFQSDIEKLIGKRPFKTTEIKLDKENIDKVDENNSLNKEKKINERNNDLSEK